MHKSLRLRNRADFSRVYRHGKSFANHQYVVYWFPKRGGTVPGGHIRQQEGRKCCSPQPDEKAGEGDCASP
ncbi:ribonuclease P protein component [Paenibacillus rhizoplanae]